MKVHVLVENTTKTEKIQSEHGLSFYIEFQKRNILFDMGSSDLFLNNAKILGLDIKNIDFAMLSHGHYDHGGGLSAFLANNEKAPVYVHKRAFGSFYSKPIEGPAHYIGLDQSIKNKERLVFLESETLAELDNGIEIFSGVKTKKLCSKSNESLFEEINGELRPDTFCHEEHLILTQNGKTVLFAGCSHNGIVNILLRFFEIKGFWPDVIMGGLHLSKPGTNMSEAPELVHEIAKRLLNNKSEYYTCHCTGEQAFSILKQDMGEKLHALSAGMTVCLFEEDNK